MHKKIGNYRSSLVGLYVLRLIGLSYLIALILTLPRVEAATLTLKASADSVVSEQNPSAKYGSENALTIGFFSGYEWRGYINWDIQAATALQGATINNAKIALYGSGTGSGSVTVIFSRASTDWTESGITWANKPGSSSLITTGYLTGAPSSNRLEFQDNGTQLRDWLQNVVNGSTTNRGIVVQAISGTTTYYNFKSRNGNTGSEPELVVDYTPPTAPAVSGFSPATGSPGTSVTITGSSFTGATSITFNGVAASYTVNSSTQITATVPASASTGKIRVTTPGGSSDSPANFGVLAQAYSVSGHVYSRFFPYTTIAGVTISADGSGTPSTTTAADGSYTLNNVASGARNLTVQRPDYFATGANVSAVRSLTVNATVNGIDFDDFASMANAVATLAVSNPNPQPGETVTVTVTLKNTNYALGGIDSYLDLSFDATHMTVGAPSGSGWSNGPTHKPKGSSGIYNLSGQEMAASAVMDSLVTALRTGSFANNGTYSFTVPLTIKPTAPAGTEIRLKYRGTIGDQRSPVTVASGGDRDQQGWNVHTAMLTVASASTTVAAELKSLPESSYVPSETRIILGTSPQRVSLANPAVFTDVPAGTYVLWGYQDGGTPWGEELWAKKSVSVSANSSVSLQRQLPYVNEVSLERTDTNQKLSGGVLPAGKTVRARILVQNDYSDALSVTLTNFFDDVGSKAEPYDSSLSVTKTVAGNGGTAEFTFAYTPSKMGYYAQSYAVRAQIDGSNILTDSGNWWTAFEVEGSRMTPSADPSRSSFYFWDGHGHATAQTEPLGSRVPVILVHGVKQDKEDPDNASWNLNGWEAWLNKFNTAAEANDRFKIYRFVYDSRARISDNGNWLASLIKQTPELQSRKFIILAYSMGGLVARQALGDAEVAARTLGLVTLATPHFGSPMANPTWVAACAVGNNLVSGNWGNGASGALGAMAHRVGFEDTPGSHNLAWAFPDQLPPAARNPDIWSLVTPYWAWLYNSTLIAESLKTPFTASDTLMATDHDRKITAYGGYITNHETPNIDLALANEVLKAVYKNGFVHFNQNDGVVPLESALMQGRLNAGTEAINLSNQLGRSLDHFQMQSDLAVIGVVFQKLVEIAQSDVPPTLSLSGLVTSREFPYHSIGGVTVTLNTGATTTSAYDGAYTFTGLNSGSYSVTASHPDFYASGETATDVKTVSITSASVGMVDFNQFLGKATPQVDLQVSNSSPKPGDSFTVTAIVRNTGPAVANIETYLDLSFDASAVEVGTPSGSGWTSGLKHYPNAEEPTIYSINGQQFAPADTLISAQRMGTFATNGQYFVTVPVTVKSTTSPDTSITFKYRATIAERRDPISTGSGLRDQQGYNVKTWQIFVAAPDGGTTSPEVNQQPISQSVTAGSDANFVVAVTGSPAPTLQWQMSVNGGGAWTNVTEGGVYSGTTTSALMIAGATVDMNNNRYRVVATNSAGGQSSDAATLTVQAATTRLIGLSGDLAFSSITVGQTDSGRLTISNSGNTALNVTGIIYPTGFNGPTTTNVPAGDSVDLTVTFAPTVAQSYNGNITVTSDATSGVNTIAISGSGVAADTGLGWAPAATPATMGPVAVTWGNGMFVAVGGGGSSGIATSPDGITWTNHTDPDTTVGLTDVAWNGTRFMALRSLYAPALVSTDGVNWSYTQQGPGSYFVGAVTAAPFGFVAAGYSAANNKGILAVTNTGDTWTAGAGTWPKFFGVARGNGLFVAVGASGAIWTSSYGDTWTSRVSGVTVDLRGIAWTRDRFTAVGNGGTILTSLDGLTWTVMNSGVTTDLNGIASNHEKTVVVGAAGVVLISADGSDWESDSSGTTNALYDVAWNGSRFVAVGASDTFLVTAAQNQSPVTKIISLSGNLAFGAQPVNTSVIRSMFIRNSGNSTLTVNGVSVPVGFARSWNNGPILSGETRELMIGFAPLLVQAYGGVITVDSDATDGVATIPVTATISTSASTAINPASHTTAAEGDSYSIAVTSNTNWLAASDQEWASVSPANGGGNGSVAVTVAANPSPLGRTATITVGGQTHALTQAAAQNQPPTISALDAITLISGASSGPLSFTLDDDFTSVGDLEMLTPTSSNSVLIPAANIVLGGIGANRTVTVTAAAAQTGTALIGLTVRDASGATQTTEFMVTVETAPPSQENLLDALDFSLSQIPAGWQLKEYNFGVWGFAGGRMNAYPYDARMGISRSLTLPVGTKKLVITYRGNTQADGSGGANYVTIGFRNAPSLTFMHGFGVWSPDGQLLAGVYRPEDSYPFPAQQLSSFVAEDLSYTITIEDGRVTHRGVNADGVERFSYSGNFEGWLLADINQIDLSIYTATTPALWMDDVAIKTYDSAALDQVTSLSKWQSAKFSSNELTDPNIIGPNADPDGDGLTNLVEYALDLDPKGPDATGLPGVGVVEAEWVYTYSRPADRPDINYEVQVSTNLSAWSTTGVTHERISTDGVTEQWQARYPLSATNVFFRLKVTQTE